MFTIFTTLLQQILMQICALESDIPKHPVRWKQQAVVAYLHLYMAVQDCEAALLAAAQECLAIRNGTTPVVKMVLNKRLMTLYTTTITVCHQLATVEPFLPSYPNEVMVYLVDMHQKVIEPFPLSLLSVACPTVQRQAGRLSSRIAYLLHQPTTADIAVAPPLRSLRTVWGPYAQERLMIGVEQGTLADVHAHILEAVRQRIAKHTVDMQTIIQDDRAVATALTGCAGVTAQRVQLGWLMRRHFDLAMLLP